MENGERELRIPRSWMESEEDFAMECGRPHRPTPPRRPHCPGWSDDFRTRFDEADFMEDEMFVEEAVNLSAGCGCRPKPPVCPPSCGCGDHGHGNHPGCGCGCGCGNDTDDQDDNDRPGSGCRPKPPVCPPSCGCDNDTDDQDDDDRPGCGNRPGDDCDCSCDCDDDHDQDDGCGNHHRCPDMSLAMPYVARQQWNGKREIYNRPRALLRGTLFVELDMPFTGKGGCQDELNRAAAGAAGVGFCDSGSCLISGHSSQQRGGAELLSLRYLPAPQSRGRIQPCLRPADQPRQPRTPLGLGQ